MASMIECRNALEDSGGNFDKAKEILRKKGVLVAQKKSGREVKNGTIESYIHPNSKIGVLVELDCETDFVAKNEEFKKLAHDIAMHVAAMDPHYLKFEDIPEEVIREEERIYREQFQDSGKPENIIREIIKGKIKKYSEESCLLSQVFIKDEDITIQDLINEYIAKLGENIQVKKFVRYQI